MAGASFEPSEPEPEPDPESEPEPESDPDGAAEPAGDPFADVRPASSWDEEAIVQPTMASMAVGSRRAARVRGRDATAVFSSSILRNLGLRR